ncbi:hypothetical protein ACLOJK_031181 [Asimina triloba]
MEKDFDSKLRLQESADNSRMQRSKSITFRAPQEHFTIQEFELGKIYGVGSYSKVVRAKKKDTGNVYALKIMDKKFITKENKISYVKLERIVLDQLDHPGIIRLFFTFQDSYSLYMALESCEGGELFDQITRVNFEDPEILLLVTHCKSFVSLIKFCLSMWMQKGRLPEPEARFYAAEVIDVLEYIHGLGLIHRDIKPENLLLTADGHIKVADFGSVKPMKDSKITVLPAATNEKACTFVGTAAYVPPEVLNSSPATFGLFVSPSHFCNRNDLWALGCTLYQMLSGTSPFKDASEWLIFQRIIARDLKFPDYFSDEARDLIDKLLVRNGRTWRSLLDAGNTTRKLSIFLASLENAVQIVDAEAQFNARRWRQPEGNMVLDTDPNSRPGAGPDGYVALKKHPFFKGVDWKKLRAQPAPKLAPELKAAEDDDAHDSEWNLSHPGDVSTLQNSVQDGSSGATSSSESYAHMSREFKHVLFFNELLFLLYATNRQEFLDPGESVVMISMVKKIQKLANKKVQLILTDKPKLIYVDPSKMMIKGNLIWSDNSNDLNVQVVNNSLFKICTPKKVISFEDSKQRAGQWKKAIEGLQKRSKLISTWETAAGSNFHEERRAAVVQYVHRNFAVFSILKAYCAATSDMGVRLLYLGSIFHKKPPWLCIGNGEREDALCLPSQAWFYSTKGSLFFLLFGLEWLIMKKSTHASCQAVTPLPLNYHNRSLR